MALYNNNKLNATILSNIDNDDDSPDKKKKE